MDLATLLVVAHSRPGRRTPHRGRPAHFAVVDFDTSELEQAAEVARADKVFPTLEDPRSTAEEHDKADDDDGVV